MCPAYVKPSSFSFLRPAHPTVYQTQFVFLQFQIVLSSFGLAGRIANLPTASYIDLASCKLACRILGLVRVI